MSPPCSLPPEPPAPGDGRALSRDQARRVAHLARLELSDAQADLFALQLSRVLEYVQQLRALDLEGVAPLFHPHERPGTPAPDEPAPGLTPEQVAKLAPGAFAPFIRVPKVLGDFDTPGAGR